MGIINKSSPLKISLMVCLTSVIMGVIFYTKTNSVFAGTTIIISFSSGIIVIFCYCASLCRFETSTKSINNKTIIIAFTLILTSRILYFNQPHTNNPQLASRSSIVHSYSTLLLLIGVVIIIMIRINIRIFKPRKKIIKTY